MPTKGERRRKDDDGDNKTDYWVKVVLEAPGCQPDDEARANDADVPERVTKDVQHQRAHVHGAGAMRVPMPMSVIVVSMTVAVVSRRSEEGCLFGRPVVPVFGALREAT